METGEMSGPSPWTPERDQQLTADWAAGFTTSQIGERMGIGKNSVIGRAHRLRLPSRGLPINLAASQSWTEEDDATLRQLYGGFLTAAEIGARMGRSVGQISYRASNLGLVAGRRAKQTGARAAFMRSSAGRDASFPGQSRPVTPCRPRAEQPGAAAATAHGGSSSQNLPEAAAMPPRVFLGTECKYPLHGDERPVVPRFCAEPVRANLNGCASPYCAAHYAECYATPGKYSTNPPPATWLKNRGMVWARG
jgi:GcrA cell cycle regulator